MDPIALIQLAGQLISLASQVATAVEKIKTIGGETEPEVDAEIVRLHADSLALTAQLDALKS